MSEPSSPEGTDEAGTPPWIRDRVIEALETVFDPEIPVNIYALGLIYEVVVNDEAEVFVRFTLTSPNCPEAETLPSTMEQKICDIHQVADLEMELVWDPPWTPEMMSEEAQLELGMF